MLITPTYIGRRDLNGLKWLLGILCFSEYIIFVGVFRCDISAYFSKEGDNFEIQREIFIIHQASKMVDTCAERLLLGKR